MLDQSYMRYWAADHEQFSRDLHAALIALGRFARRRLGAVPGIGAVYAGGSRLVASTTPAGRHARTMMVGLAPSATTTLLFLGIGALSLPPGALA